MISSLGFSHSYHDSTRFMKCSSAGFSLLSLYVNDMIIIGDGIVWIADLKLELVCCFVMKDLGFLRYFLGIEVASSPKGYLLSHSKYISGIFERARLTYNKAVDTPIELNALFLLLMVLRGVNEPSLTLFVFVCLFLRLFVFVYVR